MYRNRWLFISIFGIVFGLIIISVFGQWPVKAAPAQMPLAFDITSGTYATSIDVNSTFHILETNDADDPYGNQTTNPAWTFTITEDNQPPVAVDDSYNIQQDMTFNTAVPGVLVNDSDPESGSLTATKVSEPAHGSVTLNADGSFSYTPVAGYVGDDSFTYTASDGELDSNIATVNIQVQGEVTFSGKELLGRPTDTSITINVIPDSTIDLFYEYGTTPGVYTAQTSVIAASGGSPNEIVISGLMPDTRYYYRMQYQEPGGIWMVRNEHSFQTQRSTEATFSFTVVSDSHLGTFGNYSLYRQTMGNCSGISLNEH
jgi:VCBS repeat-containing protein